MSPNSADLIPERFFHKRVDNAFLPISVRQNKIEDVFAHFLRSLAPIPEALPATEEDDSSDPQEDAALKAAQEILDAMTERSDRFRVPNRPEDRDLILEWVRQELLVESRASNRLARDAASLIPMHLSVGQRFEPRSNPPDYGGILCELLVNDSGNGDDKNLLDALNQFMARGTGDIVAQVLEGTLWIPTDRAPRYAEMGGRRRVLCRGHGLRMQEALQSLLDYKDVIARRTFVHWLFALIDFHLATYFLRMSISAEYFGSRIEAIATGHAIADESLDWEDERFMPRLAYGRNNPEHARLLKRYPYYTSTLLIVRELAVALLDKEVETQNWEEFETVARELQVHPQYLATLNELIGSYPTESRGLTWKLTEDDKAGILSQASQTHPFTTLTLLLNFEDMARRSNNVMEWQFFYTLARDRTYGFARPARGDSLIYEFSNEALAAFVHIYAASTASSTFAGLVDYLRKLGFSFDGVGRRQLESQLMAHGLIDELADAGEAKFLIPMHSISGGTFR